MIAERVRAGLRWAKDEGKRLGRPATTVLSDPTKQPDPSTATIHYDVVCGAT